jgi:hypothetical protein
MAETQTMHGAIVIALRPQHTTAMEGGSAGFAGAKNLP